MDVKAQNLHVKHKYSEHGTLKAVQVHLKDRNGHPKHKTCMLMCIAASIQPQTTWRPLRHRSERPKHKTYFPTSSNASTPS